VGWRSSVQVVSRSIGSELGAKVGRVLTGQFLRGQFEPARGIELEQLNHGLAAITAFAMDVFVELKR
jgi:hypothetical protein